MRKNKQKIYKSIKERVYRTNLKNNKLFCHYCNKEVFRKHQDLQQLATLDHLTPRCLGGRNKDYNLVVCCAPCNNAKSKIEQQVYEKISNV